MSVGNLKDSGNQGNNFPWQLKMLRGLQAIVDSLTGSIIGDTRVPVAQRVTGSWTNAVNVYSFSVANVGAGNGTVLGATIKPGEVVNYDANGMNNYFAAGSITASGAGTELLITWITA